MEPAAGSKTIHSVSELTSKIKVLLEETFPFIWIYGEISNLRRPASGHFYFTLKDEKAQIPAVMFRGQQAGLKFRPEDGMEITGLGRIALYEPRGVYQVIFEYMEPRGVGALMKAFEQLKIRLAKEGLFDASRKKPVPFLPSTIAMITSPTGSVVHDMLNIARRRFENVRMLILPVKVQGDGAVEEIVEALRTVNTLDDVDVAILARGGGSLEDLQAFNSEKVARAIFASNVPVISAVGHETDYTIADFVADLRAPTPSAAAELALPVKRELEARRRELADALVFRMFGIVAELRKRVELETKRLVHPRKRIQDHLLRLDDLASRLARVMRESLVRRRERLEWRTVNLRAASPLKTVEKLKVKLEQNCHKLQSYMDILLNKKRFVLKESVSGLTALNPTSILARGYSITRLLPEKTVVRDPGQAPVDRKVEITLEKGRLICRVEGK